MYLLHGVIFWLGLLYLFHCTVLHFLDVHLGRYGEGWVIAIIIIILVSDTAPGRYRDGLWYASRKIGISYVRNNRWGALGGMLLA